MLSNVDIYEMAFDKSVFVSSRLTFPLPLSLSLSLSRPTSLSKNVSLLNFSYVVNIVSTPSTLSPHSRSQSISERAILSAIYFSFCSLSISQARSKELCLVQSLSSKAFLFTYLGLYLYLVNYLIYLSVNRNL